MSVPEHLWRFPTKEARISLSRRFGLPYSDQMQDWEYEVAGRGRTHEFLESYEKESLNDDERFSLMEMIIQSFADCESDLADDPLWHRVMSILDRNIGLHIYSVWYWSEFDEEEWTVVPWLRKVREKHRDGFVWA